MADEPKQGDAARHRLFLLATALVARGMEPGEAYATALRYIQGSGRGRTWISVLAECESAENRTPEEEN